MDNVAVRDVLVYYRVKGEDVFKYESMSLEFNNYQFEIPAEDVTPYGVEYFRFRAPALDYFEPELEYR